MKKIGISVLSIICAVCMMFGVMMMTNVTNTVSADAEVVLSTTAIKKSTNKDKMLLVTAIKNYESVYEVGYEGIEETDKITAETNKYYSDITAGEKTWTAETIFGNEFADAGLIVWEINYSAEESYTFKAYAKYGNVLEGGIEPVGTVEGTERTVSAEEQTPALNADVARILGDVSKYTTSDSPYGYANSAEVVDNEIVIDGRSSYDFYGFALPQSTIEELYYSGISKITFTVLLDNADHYLNFYISSSKTPFMAGDVVTFTDSALNQCVAHGATATIDLAQLLTAFKLANKNVLKVVVCDEVAWSGAGNSGVIKLTNVDVEKITVEEIALGVLVDSTTYKLDGSAYGYAGSVTANGDDVVIDAKVGSSNFGGFTWTLTSMQRLSALGVKTISFTVVIDSASATYLDMYVSGSAGSTNEYLSGDFTLFGNDKNHGIPNNGEVTVDVAKLINELTRLSQSMVKFVLCNGATWSGGGAGTVTLSNVAFEIKTVEEKAFAILSTSSNYSNTDYWWGKSISASGDTVRLGAVVGAYYCGFALNKEAVEGLIALGLGTVSFDIALDTATYLGVSIGTQTGFVSGDVETSVADQYGTIAHMIPNNGTVTLNLKATLNALEAEDKTCVMFLMFNGAEWKGTVGGNEADWATMSNISFGK